ncbi:helix-turn-helix domain-containing protein [Desulfogranum marinum]|uniref:helix-turn-helix domain-containing protein n=1 Tax=Desulfogranum marinum TaxID=453220 RepID=UPI001962915A|nr:MerR family transcriptional regulator [Desulfogranum marinum]
MTGEAAKRCGIPVRRVRYLCDQGYIDPPIMSKCGDITYRNFTERHIEQIKSIAAYQDQGFTLRMAVSKTRKVI